MTNSASTPLGTPPESVGFDETQAAREFESLLTAYEDNSQGEPKPADEQDPPPTTGEDDDNVDLDEDGKTDDDGDVDADAGAQDEPRHRVKVNGKEEEVPLSELIAGYSRNADYTRKTQALAEERKKLETELAPVREERARYAQLLDKMEVALTQELGPEPNWDAIRATEGDQAYAVQFAEYTRTKQQLEQVNAEKARVEQTRMADALQRHQTMLRQETEALIAARPEWKDETKLAEGLARVTKYGESLGFTKQDLAGVTDHRVVLALEKAMRYDQLQAAKQGGKTPPAPPQQRAPSKTAAPGSAGSLAPKPAREAQRARQRLEKSGSIQDAAAVFGQMID